MNSEVEIVEPRNRPRRREMRLCNHCAKSVFFTTKLPAMNGDNRKCLNGLSPNLAGLQVKARSENEGARILGFTIPHCPPASVKFTSMNASPLWRSFIHENELSSRTTENRACRGTAILCDNRTGSAIFPGILRARSWKGISRNTVRKKSNDL